MPTRLAAVLRMTSLVTIVVVAGRCLLWISSANDALRVIPFYLELDLGILARELASLCLGLAHIVVSAVLVAACLAGLLARPAALPLLRIGYGVAIVDAAVSFIAGLWTAVSLGLSLREDPSGAMCGVPFMAWACIRMPFFVALGGLYGFGWATLRKPAHAQWLLRSEAPSPAARWQTALMVLGAPALAVGAPVLFVVVSGLVARSHAHRGLFDADCAGGTLEIRHEIGQGGSRDEHRAVGRWIARGAEPREIAIDAQALPRHFGLSVAPGSVHGQGPHYVHFFLGGLAAAEATQIEQCAEAHAPRLLAALDDAQLYLSDGARVSTRGRIYWRAQAGDLEPVFTDGRHELLVRRDGTLERRPVGFEHGGFPGFVRARGEGTVELRCCLAAHGLRAEDFPRFLDAQGRALPDRLGVAVTPCTPPAMHVNSCRAP